MNERFINEYHCRHCDESWCTEVTVADVPDECPNCSEYAQPHNSHATRFRGKYAIAIYERDQAYGGPEEGGWWYDCGNLERIVAVTRNPDKAERMARRMNQRFNHLDRKRHVSVSSTAYSGGSYTVHIHEIDHRHTVPTHYPAQTPHYE